MILPLYLSLVRSSKHIILTVSIGEGSYSSVYHVKRKEDGKDYALKKVNMGTLGDKEK
jgi:serine/threonine protein kinase